MASFTIPLEPNTPSQEQTSTLDGVEYILRIDWNARDQSWTLGIYDLNEVPLTLGIKLVASLPLLRRELNPALPPGQLWIVDDSNEDRDPTLTDLGLRCTLMYVTADGVV